jgi:hypothetical protein
MFNELAQLLLRGLREIKVMSRWVSIESEVAGA